MYDCSECGSGPKCKHANKGVDYHNQVPDCPICQGPCEHWTGEDIPDTKERLKRALNMAIRSVDREDWFAYEQWTRQAYLLTAILKTQLAIREANK